MSAATDPDISRPGSNVLVDRIHVSPPTPSTARTDSEHSPTVLRRLSTLFNAGERPEVGGGGQSPTSGLQRPETAFPPQPPEEDRNAIKVLVVTWNMGDALPRGDLSVLLGEVPKYEPSPGKDGLPVFDVANGHPYHVVVVAAQECPAPSGMPRGLGGTLMKGVGLQKSEAYRREKEDKDKTDKETNDKDKKKEEKEAKKGEKLANKQLKKEEKNARKAARKADSALGLSPPIESTDSSEAEDYVAPPILSQKPFKKVQEDGVKQDHLPQSTVTAHTEEIAAGTNGSAVRRGADNTPSASTDSNHRKVNSINGTPTPLKLGPRGWSAMLEDWLCNGPMDDQTRAKCAQVLTSSAYDPDDLPTLTSSPVAMSPVAMSPTLTPTTATRPMSIPTSASTLQPPHSSTLHGRSPLAQSIDSPSLAGRSFDAASLMRSPSERILSRSSVDEYRPCREPGTGPYMNVAKERLLGLYTSVFVYRGCEHLIGGVDKDFVTAGLAGGRFGNKGGIGISLNLGGHRMLFVNAHLAAHTERQDARLANIAKIKQELNLDCFLPPDDPRTSLEDITDRYDTTFWCGDLNFRVDITHLHAKWLLEQKKYHDALMFDQLKKVMENPKTNPLPGFHEAEITFMPTFKYDVWKSVRSTNREIRRSMRQRRKTLERQERPSLDERGAPASNLDFVPEVEGMPEETGDSSEPPASPDARHRQALLESPVLPEIPFDDWRSDVSSIPGGPLSHNGVDAESIRSASGGPTGRDPFGRSIQQTQFLSPHTASKPPSPTKRDSASIARPSVDTSRPSRDLMRPSVNGRTARSVSVMKDKTKKLMGGILGLGSRPRHLSVKTDNLSSRRESISSLLSSETQRSGLSDDESRSSAIPVPGAPAVREMVEVSPNVVLFEKPGDRRYSVSSHRVVSPSLRRPGMTRSGSSNTLREDDLDEDFDDTVDNRVGVYDTSKKARVPSWCDRVLWKSHVIPDEEDDDLSPGEAEPRAPFYRLSMALSNFGDHFRRRSTTSSFPTGTGAAPSTSAPGDSLSRSTVMEGIPPDELAPVFDSGPGTPVAGTPVAEPSEGEKGLNATTKAEDNGPASPEGLFPTTPKRMRERSITFHGGIDDSSPESLRTRRERRATSVETSPNQRDSLRLALGRRGSGPLRRRSADPVTPSALTPITSRTSKNPGAGYDGARPRRVNSTGSTMNDSLGSAIGRFLRDLPGMFQSRVSLTHDEPHEIDPGTGTAPRRHLAGEVEVLHYGTIDDAGMRLLEGRSDHRPAIFAAAVYVN